MEKSAIIPSADDGQVLNTNLVLVVLKGQFVRFIKQVHQALVVSKEQLMISF